MSDPLNPLSAPVWKRSARLGLLWAALFFATTGVLYVLMGAIGWSATARAVCAAVAGPLLASALIVVWWLVRRPVFAEATRTQAASSQEPEEADEKPDRHGDASAI